MVLLHVKVKGESQFLFESNLVSNVGEVLEAIVRVYNGRLKVKRICSEVEDLSRHGIAISPDLAGLLEDQVRELRLEDKLADVCIPAGGFDHNPDPVEKRTGRAPKPDKQEILQRTTAEAMAKVGSENVRANVCVTWSSVQESLDILRGAVGVVYPTNLPPYDPVRMELENREELDGTQDEKNVLDPAQAVLWFSSKEMDRDKILGDYLGNNEKSKVIVKISTKSAGQPVKEPALTEEERKKLMLAEYKRREELAELDRAGKTDEFSHLNSRWADPSALKSRLHGIDNVVWK